MKCSDDINWDLWQKHPPYPARCIPLTTPEDMVVGMSPKTVIVDLEISNIESVEYNWDNGFCERITRFMGDKDMRFRAIYKTSHWEIEDTYDEKSEPNKLFFYEKKKAIKMRDWLNENVKKVTFRDKVRKVISELWGEDEIIVDIVYDSIVITEIKDTDVTYDTIAEKLDCYVHYEPITAKKSVFRIMEK